jgi:hypothetical protein
MNRFQFFRQQSLGVLCCLIALVGCGEDADPVADVDHQANTKTKTTDEKTTDQQKDDNSVSRPKFKIPDRIKRKVAKIIKRDSISGRWFVRLMHISEIPNPQQGQPPMQFGERPVVLISVTPGDGKDDKGSIEIVASRDDFAGLIIANTKVTAKSISFECLTDEGDKFATYSGQMAESGIVLGISFVQGNATPARLIPTEERTFARTPRFVVLEEQVEMMRLEKSPVPEEDMLQFAKKYPDSPLPRMGYRFIVSRFAGAGKSPRIMERVIGDYIKTQSHWGSQLEKLAHVESLQWIAATRYDPAFCLKKVDEVEALLDGSEGIESLPQQIADMRKGLEYLLALQQIESEKEEDKQAGRIGIRKLLDDSPFDPILVIALADDARLAERTDEAIDLYAQLMVLPLQEQFLREKWSQLPVRKLLPAERLAKLWKSNKTGFKDIDEYLSKVYADNIYRFADKQLEVRPNSDGNKVVLCESFTSSDNPYSIASSVALGGIKQTYPDSMVAVLRYYQQHNTSIGAVVNEESEIRCFNYYAINGSPDLRIDGKLQAGIAGPLAAAPTVYQDLRETIDQNLETKTDVAISLTAMRTGDDIRVTANVTGTDPTVKTLRLRIVLAESGIEFKSFNGIRQHDLVVRKLIGGDGGVAATADAFQHEETVDLKVLRGELAAYLKRFEDNYSKTLDEKPLDFEDLHVVAFVQDDATKDVLQTVVVPVKTIK